jgi:hypothetical protein
MKAKQPSRSKSAEPPAHYFIPRADREVRRTFAILFPGPADARPLFEGLERIEAAPRRPALDLRLVLSRGGAKRLSTD